MSLTQRIARALAPWFVIAALLAVFALAGAIEGGWQ